MSGEVEQPAVRAPLTAHAREMSVILGTLAIDGAFLVGLALFNVLVGSALEHFHLEGTDKDIQRAAQIILGASTLGSMMLVVIRDLWRGVRRIFKGVPSHGT